MKIYSIEVQTDLGRRVVQLDTPLDVDPPGPMPPQFRSLSELLWGVLCEFSTNPPAPAPKVKA